MRKSLSTMTPSAQVPQAELCRAFGLAAVAAELNLQIEMMEPEVAEAVGMGAAALFLAGYGPKGIHSRSRRAFNWDDTRSRVRRDVLRSRRIARQAGAVTATLSESAADEKLSASLNEASSSAAPSSFVA